MRQLFDTTEINGLTLQNRFVRSATWEGMAGEDGSCTDRLSETMVDLAEGGIGLIISSHAYVSREGQAGPRQLGIYDNSLIAGFQKMTHAVHERGGRILLQLAHAGFRAPFELTGMESLGPSSRKDDRGYACSEMTVDDVQSLVEAFAEGAERAQESEFDGVQIHAAHGYLLSQFLSPVYNRRVDAYGGTIKNRARIVVEVLRAIRSRVGSQFPVLIKINSEDFLPDGLSVDEMIEVSLQLEKEGIDAVELSGGTADSGKFAPVRLGKIGSEGKEGYYRIASQRLKKRIAVPVILVGGIRSYNVAKHLLEGEYADYFALSRPLIREPHLIRRWREGNTSKAECLSDNLCFRPIRAGRGMYCYAEKLIQSRKRASRGKGKE